MKIGNTSFFKSAEGIIFLTGCGLLVIELIVFIMFERYIPEVEEEILSMIVADLAAGRGISILLGLSLKLSEFYVILTSVLFDITLLFIFYPPIYYFYRSLVEPKILEKVLRSTKRSVEKHQHRIEKWGALGIAVFVWVPLFNTGPLVGTIIGKLIGMRTIVVFTVIVISIVISAVSWTFAFDFLFEINKRAGRLLPFILVAVILGAIVAHRLYWLYKQRK